MPSNTNASVSQFRAWTNNARHALYTEEEEAEQEEQEEEEEE